MEKKKTFRPAWASKHQHKQKNKFSCDNDYIDFMLITNICLYIFTVNS
jgi:hypothetical protein